MTEYVYALHEFSPEHEDELAFHPGDRIQIIEKDDVYGDGWWQGRTEDGRTGLFPESYTTSKPPSDSPSPQPQQSSPQFQPVPDIRLSGGLVPLEEESEEFHDASSHPHPRQTTTDNGVMQATMTDVQHAIDQLAVKDRDDTDRRTFSFASTRDTETDREEDHDPDDKEWHKDTRSRLAENAQRVNETISSTNPANASRERLAPPIPLELSDESDDDYDIDDTHHTAQSSVPPTARAQDTTFPQNAPPSQNSNPTEKLNGITPNNASKGDLANSLGVHKSHSPVDFSPAMARSELDPEDAIDVTHPSSAGQLPPVPPPPTASVPQAQKPSSSTPTRSTTSVNAVLQPSAHVQSKATPTSSSVPTPVSPTDIFHPSLSSANPSKPGEMQEPKPVLLPAATIASPTPTKSSTPFVVQNLNEIAANPLPSPTASVSRKPSSTKVLNGIYSTPDMPPPTVPSAAAAHPPSTPLLQMTSNNVPGSGMSGPLSAAPSTSGFSTRSANYAAVHPTEWTQVQVVDWLKSKGFDETIWSKFIEHEIDGEVLLQLDLTMLKDEMGILALGKRMRLANAISELRRPPSVDTTSSRHINAIGMNNVHTGSGYLHTSSEQQYTSQPHERHISHGSSVALSSINSPIAPSYSTGNSASVVTGTTTNTTVMSPNFIVSSPSGDVAPHALGDDHQSAPGMKQSKSEGTAAGGDKQKAGLVGLGFASSSGMAHSATVGPGVHLPNGRPVSLNISPSDSALVSRTLSGLGSKGNESTGTAKQGRQGADDKSDDERAALSEGESSFLGRKLSSKRKAVRSSFASSDKDTDTKSSSLPTSPSIRSSTFGHGWSKKSIDAHGNTKSHDRLSFFGGSLGKSRKPAPSTTSDVSDSPSASTNPEKPARSLSRLYLGSGSHGKRAASNPQHRVAPPQVGTVVPPAPRSPERLKKQIFSSTVSPPRHKITSAMDSSTEGSHPPHTRLTTHQPPQPPPELGPGATALEKIGEPDHAGWMRKRGERYNAWKLRYFVLKGQHLYYVKSLTEEKIKGYIDIAGYKVVADENVHPGRYGFRIVHDVEKPHYFSSVEQPVVREWMKALMKATIGRDWSRPVVSSCNIPTIPLSVAQAMNPAPRPPSPTARAATQKAMRRENVNQLSNRDALVLMGMGGEPDATDKARLDQFFHNHADAMNGAGLARSNSLAATMGAPPRPAREVRKRPSTASSLTPSAFENSSSDIELINWINSNLPPSAPLATDLSLSLSTGLTLYRLAESIKGVPTDVPDSAFPTAADQDKLEGLFKLFDFLLDNDVRMGSVSINDVRTGNKEKISQLVKSLKAWQEKRVSLTKSITTKALSAGPWLAVGH